MSVRVSDSLLKENCLFIFIYVYVCVCTWDYVYGVWRYLRRQEHVGFPGTGAIIGCEQLVWVLGAKPRSSTREVNVLTRWAISLAQDWMISQGMGSHDSLNRLHFQDVSFTVYLHETTLFFILHSPCHNRPFFMKVRPTSTRWQLFLVHCCHPQ